MAEAISENQSPTGTDPGPVELGSDEHKCLFIWRQLVATALRGI